MPTHFGGYVQGMFYKMVWMFMWKHVTNIKMVWMFMWKHVTNIKMVWMFMWKRVTNITASNMMSADASEVGPNRPHDIETEIECFLDHFKETYSLLDSEAWTITPGTEMTEGFDISGCSLSLLLSSMSSDTSATTTSATDWVNFVSSRPASIVDVFSDHESTSMFGK